MRELFRRMVFNILIDNTDDHEKNHALVMRDGAQYELSLAYDLLPSGQAIGFQQMRVGTDQEDSTMKNALSMCRHFSLTRNDAVAEIRKVSKVIGNWKVHFKALGVSRGDIELLAEQIDRPFLQQQRSEFS